MNHEVRYELTQPVHDADGNVVHRPGTRFEAGAKELDGLPAGAYKPVIVDTDLNTADNPHPEHNTAEQPQRVTQPGPRGDGDQVKDPKGQNQGDAPPVGQVTAPPEPDTDTATNARHAKSPAGGGKQSTTSTSAPGSSKS